MGLWLLQHKEAIHSIAEIIAAVGVIFTTTGIILGGIFALIQYVKGNQLRAAETLLKVEEEFRAVLPVLAQIEDVKTFERVIVPVSDNLFVDRAQVECGSWSARRSPTQSMRITIPVTTVAAPPFTWISAPITRP